jgi:hypothetical protein
VLYWRDALHEGPVPAVGPEELRRIRAAFLIEAGADDRDEAMAMFAERDRILEANRDGEYVLWFEADLYNQLQIIQILSGVDRHIGGVHLRGRQVPWRWDDGTESIVPCG